MSEVLESGKTLEKVDGIENWLQSRIEKIEK